jgi:hypothetical protein
VTFVIAKITDRDAGKVMLLADTKLTDRNDETLTRRTLANPCQKVVIVNDDVVVGFAGDTPESALKKVVGLRSQCVEEIEDALPSFTAEMQKLHGVSKKFLVVVRKPTTRIIVIDNGTRDDRTDIGTGWIGDPDAFDAFSRVFQSEASHSILDLAQRFVLSMVSLVGLEDVASVGGYMVRVSGSRDKPFRFGVNQGFVLPGDLEASVTRQSGASFGLQLSLPEGADPSSHLRLPVPGTGPTYSALAHYIPESGTAWLHTHEEPWREPKRLTVHSLTQLVATVKTEYKQLLDPEIPQYVLDRYPRQ